MKTNIKFDKEVDYENIGSNKMDKLKMGDIVEVFLNEEWKDRIFIKEGQEESVIVVAESYEDSFQEGRTFETERWKKDLCRIKKELEYTHFTFEDAEDIIGMKVKSIESGYVSLVIVVITTGVYLNEAISFQKLFKYYKQLDDTPCGKLVK